MSMSRFLRRRALPVVAALAVAPVVLAATPAEAGSMYFSKSSGRLASANWLEVGELPNVAGNIHLGFLNVEELSKGRANVWGYVDDLTCPEGVTDPGPIWGHEEEPIESPCTYEGSRFIEGGSVTFRMDRTFNTATLTGSLNVFGGHGGPTGSPAVDMTWTGVGDVYKSTQTDRWTDGTTTSSYRYTFSGRDAVVSGRIGVMIFDDEAGEYSQAQMGAYRDVSRSRTP